MTNSKFLEQGILKFYNYQIELLYYDKDIVV